MINGRRPKSAPTHSTAGLIRQQEGSSFLQTLLLLPIFVMIVVGGYEIWKTHSVKESLRSGTYQATRYLSVNPNTSSWRLTARNDFIVPELLNNPLAGNEAATQVRVIARPPVLACGELFIVRSELPWQAIIPFAAPQNLAIVVEYEGEVACTPEGEPE